MTVFFSNYGMFYGMPIVHLERKQGHIKTLCVYIISAIRGVGSWNSLMGSEGSHSYDNRKYEFALLSWESLYQNKPIVLIHSLPVTFRVARSTQTSY